MKYQLNEMEHGPVSRARILQSGSAYLLSMAVANLVWEVAQAPLYTIWAEGTRAEIAFAIAHCTIGDVLIAATSLMISWLAVGRPGWPVQHFKRVAIMTLVLGVGYTVFSEWLNISVRGSWTYRELMPTIGPLQTGLGPLMQWIVLPLLSFLWLRRALRQ